MKLYIGNLSYDTTEGELQSLSSYGTVESIHLITDGASGRSKGLQSSTAAMTRRPKPRSRA